MNKRLFNSFISMLLVMCMCVSYIPAYAAEDEEVFYTVSTEDENGNITYQTVKAGDTAIEPDMSYLGCEVAWIYRNVNPWKYFTFDTTITEDISLRAVFPYSVNIYYANIDGSYNDEPDRVVTYYGLNGQRLYVGNFYKTGFVTDGPNKSVVVASDGSSSIEYYYPRDTVTVTVDNGKNSTYNIKVVYEDTISEPNAPEKEGYILDGWFDTNDKRIDFSKPITKNITIHPVYKIFNDAVYTIKYYQQNIEDDEYTMIEAEDLVAEVDTVVTAKIREYTGFHIVSEVNDLQATVNEDGTTVINVFYNRNLLSVSLDEEEIAKVKYGDVIAEPEIPEKEGYTPDGWVDEEGNKIDFNEPINDNIIVKPNYVANTDTSYVIGHYKQNFDGTYTLIDTVPGSGTTDAEVTAEGKDYEGFTIVTDESDLTSTIAANGSTTIKVYYDRNQYRVVFNPGDGTLADSLNEQAVLFEGTLTLPTPTRSGYTFNGWFTQESGGAQVTEDTSVTENMELYAHYTRVYVPDYTPSRPVTQPTEPVEAFEEFEDIETPLGPGFTFDDVRITDWFYNDVNEAVKLGFIESKSDTDFNPNGSLNRADMAKMLAVFNKGNIDTYKTFYDFVDVNENTRYHAEIAYCNSMELMMGYGQKTFGAYDVLTREQMALILYRLLKNTTEIKLDESKLEAYDFTNVSEWALPSMKWVVTAGLMDGEVTTKPMGAVTRAEASALIVKDFHILNND